LPALRTRSEPFVTVGAEALHRGAKEQVSRYR
jgi:hypothetical protein